MTFTYIIYKNEIKSNDGELFRMFLALSIGILDPYICKTRLMIWCIMKERKHVRFCSMIQRTKNSWRQKKNGHTVN